MIFYVLYLPTHILNINLKKNFNILNLIFIYYYNLNLQI